MRGGRIVGNPKVSGPWQAVLALIVQHTNILWLDITPRPIAPYSIASNCHSVHRTWPCLIRAIPDCCVQALLQRSHPQWGCPGGRAKRISLTIIVVVLLVASLADTSSGAPSTATLGKFQKVRWPTWTKFWRRRLLRKATRRTTLAQNACLYDD